MGYMEYEERIKIGYKNTKEKTVRSLTEEIMREGYKNMRVTMKKEGSNKLIQDWDRGMRSGEGEGL